MVAGSAPVVRDIPHPPRRPFVSHAGPLGIARADVLVLRHVLSRTRYFSTGSNVTRDSVVVRIADRGGRVGWGETYLVPGAVDATRAVVADLVGAQPDDEAARL